MDDLSPTKSWRIRMKTKLILLFLLFSSVLYANEKKRIVALNGTLTEIIFALDAGDDIVGCDTSSIYPEKANLLPKVGYQRALSAEGILSLKPSLILGTSDAGPPNVIAQIKKSVPNLFLFEDTPTLDSVWKKIEWTGKNLGKSKEASKLVGKLQKDYQILQRKIDTTKKPKILFIYARGAGSVQVAGKENGADTMIKLAGGENAVNGFTGFKPITSEMLAGLKIDFILLPSRSLESLGGISGLKKIPGIELTGAGKEKNIIQMDDLVLLGFSTRVVQGIEELAKLIGTLP
jgi:iron complex transport system substrate-binding protein